ncbi:hypothetical protein [Winogradskyella tangerina]|uniref:hypothetical protein n=1 Tax=Winogradskyella tangerina TaxID=2023240 RepID=UPI000DBE96AC|nr:hypothetical protein [Winogradskyella tangerina]
MKKTNYLLLVAFSVIFVTLSHGQHRRYTIKNGFALGGGITQFDILTDQLETTSGNGWIISASTTADIPHKWYNISFGMQLSENNIEISGLRSADGVVFISEQLEYKVFTAQLAMLLHVKAVKNLITLDVGPMIQYNGKLELQDDNQENLFVDVDNSPFAAAELEDISQFNVNGAVGATLGLRFLKLRAQYIYGFTNMLNKLNDKNLTDSNFKGNQSMLVFSALITF